MTPDIHITTTPNGEYRATHPDYQGACERPCPFQAGQLVLAAVLGKYQIRKATQ